MITLTPAAATLDTDTPTPSIRRTPIYLQSQGEALFAWLHRRESMHGLQHGIVICSPIGYEQIHAHRSLRHLADALAAVGFAVVRFDYHGTGDSAGVDELPDRHPTWLVNIRDVQSWLRHQGCTAVSLLGVRLGATMAMEVAAAIDVENLVLWAPIVKGRQYVREMQAIGMTMEKKPKALPNAPDDIEAAGFVITKQTAEALRSLDLLGLRPCCHNVLIVARDDTAEDRKLLEHLVSQGVHTTQLALPGYADMMAEPHFTKVPTHTLSKIVAWLLERAAKPAPSAQTSIEEFPNVALASIAHRTISADGTMAEHFILERALRLSEKPDLFGIISEPKVAQRNARPVILLINAGAAYRVGPSRFYVQLARQLAAQGFRCLRMDLCGLGDSVAGQGEHENDPYCETAFRDIERTLNYVYSELHVDRVALMGLCSGAYLAFQAAAQSHSKSLVESVLINPLTYYWRDGMRIGAGPNKDLRTYHYYMQAACHPLKWLKFLSGNTKIGMLGAMKLLTRRFRLRRHEAPVAMGGVVGGLAEKPGHPLLEDVSADLERIAKSGRQLTCFFSRSDPGYRLLMFHAATEVEELKRAGTLKVHFIDDADHTFSERVPRLEAVRAIVAHFCERY